MCLTYVKVLDSDGDSKDVCARKMELFLKTYAMRLCSS